MILYSAARRDHSVGNNNTLVADPEPYFLWCKELLGRDISPPPQNEGSHPRRHPTRNSVASFTQKVSCVGFLQSILTESSFAGLNPELRTLHCL